MNTQAATWTWITTIKPTLALARSRGLQTNYATRTGVFINFLFFVECRKKSKRLLFQGLATTGGTGAAGGDQTNLLTRRCVTSARGRVTNVLMVTPTVGMFDRVHRNTTDARPAVSLCFVFVERCSGLEHRFVDTATTSDDANHGTGDGRDDLLLAGWQTDAGLASVLRVANVRETNQRGGGRLCQLCHI